MMTTYSMAYGPKPLLGMDEWKMLAERLFDKPDEVKDQAWGALYALALFVKDHAMSGFDFRRLAVILFLPHDAEWNRKVELMVQWMVAANDKHFGKSHDFGALREEWKLSGLQPPWE